jgi:hypothetical protein
MSQSNQVSGVLFAKFGLWRNRWVPIEMEFERRRKIQAKIRRRLEECLDELNKSQIGSDGRGYQEMEDTLNKAIKISLAPDK